MEYLDNRGKRVIFVGNCILNQNARAFGVAVTRGAFADFIQILLRKGIGIEQLPCPECLVWGGIGRKRIYKWQPLLFNSVGKWWFPVLQFLVKATTLLTHGRVCKREGRRAADWIEDHIKQGFEVVGVITANDSPTCGVTKTMDLIDVMKRAKFSGMSLNELERPRLEKLGPFTQSVLIDGEGAFAGAIKRELIRRRMNIQVVGWNPWDDPQTESSRIDKLLDLHI